jgi:hypothetical protein
MKDHTQADGGGSDPSGTLATLAEHQDCVNQTDSVENGGNSKPKQWHRK